MALFQIIRHVRNGFCVFGAAVADASVVPNPGISMPGRKRKEEKERKGKERKGGGWASDLPLVFEPALAAQGGHLLVLAFDGRFVVCAVSVRERKP